MKSLINFLILVLIVAIVGFLGWSALDKTLFADAEQQVPPQEETGIPAAPQPTPEAPIIAISPEEAFGTTSDNTPAQDAEISCENAGETIGAIYDMHIEGKSTTEISQYLAGLDAYSQTEIEMYSQIAQSIEDAPSDQLLPRQEMVEQFRLQCEAALSN